MRGRGAVAAAVAGLLVLGGCGGSGAGGSGTSVPVTGPPVTDVPTTGVAAGAERIIPVDGDLAEIVFALGLGDQVVATDLSATYPPAADALPEIGYQRALTAEPIAAFEPTLVLATDLAGPPETLEQLRQLGIPVEVIEREPTLDGPAAKIRAAAAVLGVPERGEALAATLEQEVEAALASAAGVTERPRVAVLYVRGESVQLMFGEGSGFDEILPAVGAVDVAAELGIGETAQLSAEALVQAAPDVLVLSTSGLESVGGLDGLLAIPGIAQTPAGEQGRVLTYEDQFLFGGGPRFGQLLSTLVTDLHERQP